MLAKKIGHFLTHPVCLSIQRWVMDDEIAGIGRYWIWPVAVLVLPVPVRYSIFDRFRYGTHIFCIKLRRDGPVVSTSATIRGVLGSNPGHARRFILIWRITEARLTQPSIPPGSGSVNENHACRGAQAWHLELGLGRWTAALQAWQS